MRPQQELVLFRNPPKADVFEDICEWYDLGWDILDEDDRTDKGMKRFEKKCNEVLGKLIHVAERYGLSGNLVHCYLTYVLINSENAFSLACERRRVSLTPGNALTRVAKQDLMIFMVLYAFPFAELIEDVAKKDALTDYRALTAGRVPYPKEVRSAVNALSKALGTAAVNGEADQFMKELVSFYRRVGVGKLGLYKAFRMSEKVVEGGNTIVSLEQMTHCSAFTFRQLVGYESQIAQLCDNTEQFLKGVSCNNVLLFGDSGTGKSSSIKACMNRYFPQGLRMIEVYKHQFQHLPDIIKSLKGRNYRFIIYMDDLSFEEFEVEYKYLKAVIEGGLEEKPDNVSIYATSNRRHLVKETYRDNQEMEDELHGGDTVQEKLSLSARFGVTIFYGSPDKREFERMVLELAREEKVDMPEAELLHRANQWELRHSGMKSGRMAAQFVADLKGKQS